MSFATGEGMESELQPSQRSATHCHSCDRYYGHEGSEYFKRYGAKNIFPWKFER